MARTIPLQACLEVAEAEVLPMALEVSAACLVVSALENRHAEILIGSFILL